AAFEVSGILGMLVAGRVTDKYFGGRGPRVCVFCMILASVFVALLWLLPSPPIWMATMILMAAGFSIYGPQALVGIAAANLATKRAASSAAGFTGLFGYASTLVSGWGLGLLVDKCGWDYALAALIGAGLIGTVVFLMAWKAKANGYED
ncbi:MAG: MFS transporter, partial [Bacteroidota bacterium]|nr:MFS transporter [Bacteroidota bacterium]